SRASGSSSSARRRWGAISAVARSANVSDRAFLPMNTASELGGSPRSAAVNASIAWASASIPANAVTVGGQPYVSVGSTTATVGISARLEIPTLSAASGSVITDTGVTSEPVPAVVGTATTGATGPGIC